MATTLTLEQMKQFVRDHFDEVVNKNHPGAIRENVTPNFYDHDGPGGRPTGVDGDERLLTAMHESMPDLRVTIDDMVAEGDKVVCRNTWRWTDRVSRARMRFRGFAMWRFEGVKIAERWAVVTPPAEDTE